MKTARVWLGYRRYNKEYYYKTVRYSKFHMRSSTGKLKSLYITKDIKALMSDSHKEMYESFRSKSNLRGYYFVSYELMKEHKYLCSLNFERARKARERKESAEK